MSDRTKIDPESVSDDVAEKGGEKPQGMPLTLGSGGYGGTKCTSEQAEETGKCPGND